MLSPAESRAALKRVTAESVNYSVAALKRVSGSPDVRRARLLELVPAIVGYYSDGSSALAADFYEDQREAAGERSRFVAVTVVTDRVVKLRRGVAWAADPLFGDGGEFEASKRLAEVVQLETARPYRDTILSNSSRDTASVGWRRVTRGGCSLCRMLADRGAVYREATARFATHPNCGCTAQPVFGANDTGEEASAVQYVASRRSRTPAQQTILRDYLNEFF